MTMDMDATVLLLALFGAFVLGFVLGLLVNLLRRMLVGAWRAPGRMVRGVGRFGGRLRSTLLPEPQEGPAGAQEIPLPSQPIGRAVALLLTFPVRRAQVLFRMGEEAYAAGRPRVAAGHYRTALLWDHGHALLPLHIRANLRLGQIRADGGDLTGAIAAYERVRDLDPANMQPYLQLGQLYFRAGQSGQALYELSRALELNPTNLDVRYHLFQIYQQSGMQQEAARQLRLLKAGEDPDAVTGLFLQHGREHLQHEELELAAIDYQLVLELDPHREEAVWALGDIYYQQGLFESALRVWGRGLWFTQSPALDERLLGLAREGLAEGVIQTYQQALLLHPRAGGSYLALGQLALEQGHPEQAAGYWEQAVRAQPSLVEAHLRLEELYQRIGRPEQAGDHLRAALQTLWGRETVYRCRRCGHVTPVEQPYCFACRTWSSLIALPRAELADRPALISSALSQEARSWMNQLGSWWGRMRNQLLNPPEEEEPDAPNRSA